ncbi:LysM peptidoglycan-binding domain-containing M23 family metallopeptidase [Sphingomonas sp. CV7422]|uniref:LysM peptidoglycan-binding domain-containing M23 family metallopeptidase n=1 Tax=Sphingomonas sp. CV7422 TaxID=3018036 RepID=UPI0022FF0EF6|nr:LysM peptidoglycan-binding domain-containing M23 family metallopeptidase [Sphingomonas sp. CV7422]
MAGRWPRRTGGVALAALALGGCIPSVEGYAPADPPPPVAQRDAPAPAPLPRDDRPAPRPLLRPLPRPLPVATPRPTRPAWEARPVIADAPAVAEQVHIVAPGESLAQIAQTTGAAVGPIAQANGLVAPYDLRPGQRLVIPGGRYHRVQSGETGIAIARAYGVAWSRIVTANQLAEPYILRAGQRVLIPGDPGRPPSVAERAAAFRLDIDDILTGGEPATAPRQAPVRPITKPGRELPPTAVVAAPARLQGGFAWPVDGQIVRRFGPGRSGERNDGIKIAVPVSTPIHATADGVVAYAGDGIAALGGLIIIRHGNGWTSVYGHAAKLLVARGQSVKRGQTIALSGDTGFADQPELHFELRKGRTPVDPLSQLPRR